MVLLVGIVLTLGTWMAGPMMRVGTRDTAVHVVKRQSTVAVRVASLAVIELEGYIQRDE